MSTFEKAHASSITETAEIDRAAAYGELRPKVYHYFCLRVRDRVQAEDLTAATLERAWRDRERYRRDLGSFANWLFGIAQHEQSLIFDGMSISPQPDHQACQTERGEQHQNHGDLKR